MLPIRRKVRNGRLNSGFPKDKLTGGLEKVICVVTNKRDAKTIYIYNANHPEKGIN
jgi:hypothetical protein